MTASRSAETFRSVPGHAATTFVAWLLTLYLALIVATALVIGELWILLAGLALPVAVVLWQHPAYGAAGLLVQVFVTDWLTEEAGLLPHAATWATEGLIALLLTRAVAHHPGARRLPLTVIWLCLLLALLAAISALIHGVPLVRLGLGLRGLVRFPLLFTALVLLGLRPQQWRWLFRLFIGLMTLQIPVALIQAFVLAKTDDQAFGTLRSTGVLAVLVVFTVTMLVSRYMVSRRVRFLAHAAAFAPLPIVGEAKAFFVLTPLALGTLLLPFAIRRPVRTALVAVLAGVTLFYTLKTFSAGAGNADLLFLVRNPPSFETLLQDPRTLGELGADEAEVTVAFSFGNRWNAIMEAVQDLRRQAMFTALVGMGVGSRTFTATEIDAGSSSILAASPLATRMSEYGFGGVLMYWTLIGCLTIQVLRVRPSDQRERAIRAAFPAITLVFVVAEAYTEVTNDALGFSFWFLAALLLSASQGNRRPVPARP